METTYLRDGRASGRVEKSEGPGEVDMLLGCLVSSRLLGYIVVTAFITLSQCGAIGGGITPPPFSLTNTHRDPVTHGCNHFDVSWSKPVD